MKRFHQLLLVGTFLPLCWLLMQAVHEVGHIVFGLATGGTVAKVVLHPLTISRTDTLGSFHPLIVVWGGPAVGALAPLALWGIAKAMQQSWSYLLQFFAGFCLIANGGYLGAGSFSGAGDAGDLTRYGSPTWSLWLFAAITFPLGLYLWNGLGPKFGLGPSGGVVDRRAALASCGLLVLVLVLELVLSPQ